MTIKPTVDQPETSAPQTARFARLVGRRPGPGPAVAAKQVAEDVSALLRAELDLAKAEVAGAVKAKAMGAGLFVGAGVMGWLGIHALLVTLGFVLAIWLPGWAAALIVTVLLFAGAGAAALIGKKRLAAKLSVETVKANVQRDVEVTREGISHVVSVSRNGHGPEPVVSEPVSVRAGAGAVSLSTVPGVSTEPARVMPTPGAP